MKKILSFLFLTIFSIFILRAAIYSIASVLRMEMLHPWPEVIGGSLIFLIIIGYIWKIRAAEFDQEQSETN